MNAQPLIAVDVVMFQFDGTHLNAVLGKRQYAPFKDEYAIPGVLLIMGETLHDSATRALTTKLHAPENEVGTITQVGAFDNSDRDPRGPTMCVLHYTATTDANFQDGDNIFAPVNNLPELPFDHNNLIAAAKARLAEHLFTRPEPLKELLGTQFTTSQAKQLATELGILGDPSNFTRLLRKLPFLTEEDSVQVTGTGRPAKKWSIAT